MRLPIADMVSDEDRRKLVRAVQAGASNTTCADLIGISRSGYSTLLDTDEALRIELGKARAEAIVEVLEALKKGRKAVTGWLSRVVRDVDYVSVDRRILAENTEVSESLLEALNVVTKSDAYKY